MARYERHSDDQYANLREVPMEPMGFWGLSGRSRPWAREEDRWGTSRQEREARGRRQESGWPERPPRGASRGRGYIGFDDERFGGSPRGWERGGRDWDRDQEWDAQASDREWGREREWQREREAPEDWRARQRAQRAAWRTRHEREPGIDWNGWGYQATGPGRGAWDYGRPGYPRRTSSDEWGQYAPNPRADEGAWNYGRHVRQSLGATGEENRESRWGGGREPGRGRGRPDAREGAGWNEVGPGRWTRERRPDSRGPYGARPRRSGWWDRDL